MPQNMICTQRLALTADGSQLVPDTDPRAATLYAAPGDEIPASAAEKFGLVDGALPGAEQVALTAQLSDEELAEIKAKAEAAAKAQAETKPVEPPQTKPVAKPKTKPAAPAKAKPAAPAKAKPAAPAETKGA